MYGVSSNSNKENSSSMEIPEDAAALPGQTQGGRGVQQQQVVVQLSDQIKTESESMASQQTSRRCAPESVHVLTDEPPPISPDDLRQIKQNNAIARRKNLADQAEELCQETTKMLQNLAEQRRSEAESASRRIAERIGIIKAKLLGDVQCKHESAGDFEREFCAVVEHFRIAGVSEESLTSGAVLPLCLVIVRMAKKHVCDLIDKAMRIEKSEEPERSDDSDDDSIPDEEHDMTTRIRESSYLSSFLSEVCIDEAKHKKGNELGATEEFQREILNFLERLDSDTRIWMQDDTWPLCQTVVAEGKVLKNRNNDRRSCHHNLAFMRMIMSPVYELALGKLFEGLQQQVNAKSSWECSEARIVGLDLYALEGRSMCDYLILRNKIVGQFIRNELNYMESLVDFPLEFAVDRISNIIDRILTTIPKLFSDYVDLGYDAVAIKCQKETIHQEIARKAEEWSDDSRKKSFDELEKMVLDGTANEDNKRQYTDFLSWRFVQMVQANGGVCLDAQGSARLLGKLAEFHAQYAQYINTPHALVLRQDLGVVISDTARRILLAIRDQCDDSNELKETLTLINDMCEKGFLDGECLGLYRDCTKPRTAMGTTTVVSPPADFLCRELVNKIFLCVQNSHSEPGYLIVADQLKRLLDEYGQTIDTLDDASVLKDAITSQVQKKLCRYLFDNIINEFASYNVNKPGPAGSIKWPRIRIDNEMSRHKPAFIRLRPYMFLLKDSVFQDSGTVIPHKYSMWQLAACAAWHNDIERMSKAATFSENDIDQLLYLQEIAPTVPDPIVKPLLQSVLAKVLQFAEKQENGASTSSSVNVGAEKIMALRDWAHKLESV